MFRYVLAATALKAFSTNTYTKRLYRSLGDHFGGPLARRSSYIKSHVKRGELFRDLCEKYDVLRGGDRLLEIGTGWIHWHSLYQRLFYEVSISMLDIWDCRQLNALHEMFGELRQSMEADSTTDPNVLKRLESILSADSFDDLYQKFGLEYVVNEQGSLARFADNSMDCVFSFHVLEHVPRESTVDLAMNIDRVLKPGAFSIHQIGIDDHLTHYDSKESPKNYLRYSDKTWKMFFENNLQYINRLQMSEWLALFEKSGLNLVETIPVYCDIGGLKVHKRFGGYAKEDLECTILTIVHQKPFQNIK
jgi:SAM-dependent methyltransferase